MMFFFKLLIQLAFVSGAFAGNWTCSADVTITQLSAIAASNGTITSPNYPSSYSSNLNCQWQITVPTGKKVKLTFVYMDLEYRFSCSKDYVELRNGSNPYYSRSIGRYCGTFIPSPQYSSSNIMLVKFKSDYSGSGTGFKANWEAVDYPGENIEGSNWTCSADVTIAQLSAIAASNGTITSPNYPRSYSKNLNCRWQIIVPTGKKVKLTFVHMHLERHSSCSNDYVELRNGFNPQNSRMIGRYCGTFIPSPQYSSSNIMLIKFKSDHTYTGSRAGFKAKWEAVDYAKNIDGRTWSCSADFTITQISAIAASNGTITSPNYPRSYSKNLNCQWQITVPTGKKVKLTFLHMDLEFQSSCLSDYVELRNGFNLQYSRRIGRYCGTSIPSPQYSSSNIMLVKFSSDYFGSGTGFKANWEAVDPADDIDNMTWSCSADVTITQISAIAASNGTITSPNYPRSYSRNLKCQWKITVPTGKKVKLTFPHMDLEYQSSCSNDYVELRNGFNPQNSRRIGRYCGTSIPSPQYSSSNIMLIKFSSDYSRSGTGFKAKWEAVDYPGELSINDRTWSCSADVTIMQLSAIAASNGTITSPNYPRSYSRNLNCHWQITVPTGKKVKLTFVHMDLEYQSSCSNDYVELRHGFNYLYSRMIGRYCGTSIPSPKYSRSSIMLVRFNSDNSGSGTGFKANWKAVDHAGENEDDTHNGRSSSSRSSSGRIGGSVAGLIVLIIFVLVVYYYCKYRRNRPVVIVRETTVAAQPTIVVANTNVVQQQQVPMANMAPQHPQARTNPAYSPPSTGPNPGQYPQQPSFQGVPYAQTQPTQQGYSQPAVAPYPLQATQPPTAPSCPPQATQPPPYTEVPTKQ